jgi:hypothetical protein
MGVKTYVFALVVALLYAFMLPFVVMSGKYFLAFWTILPAISIGSMFASEADFNYWKRKKCLTTEISP